MRLSQQKDMDINDVEVFLQRLKGKTDTMETGIFPITHFRLTSKQNQNDNKSIKEIYG